MRASFVRTAALLILSFASLASAQSPSSAELATTGGVKGGFNVAHVVENSPGNPTLAFDSRTGIAFGGFLRRSIDEHLAIQPEVLVSQQGYSFGRSSIRVTYLQIPVLGLYRFSGENVRPFIAAGPALGIKMGVRAFDLGEYSQSFSENVDSSVTGSDVSLVIGGGIDRQRLSIDVRYWFGLKDVNTSGNEIDKNRIFSVMVGYQLGGR